MHRLTRKMELLNQNLFIKSIHISTSFFRINTKFSLLFLYFISKCRFSSSVKTVSGIILGFTLLLGTIRCSIYSTKEIRIYTLKFYFSRSWCMCSFKLYMCFDSNLTCFYLLSVPPTQNCSEFNSSRVGIYRPISMIFSSPSIVNTIFSFVKRLTFPLSSVTWQ